MPLTIRIAGYQCTVEPGLDEFFIFGERFNSLCPKEKQKNLIENNAYSNGVFVAIIKNITFFLEC